MLSGIRQFVLGSPLPTAAEALERLTKVKALAVFSSDALSSVAYATEEILLVLVLAGTGALYLSLPIAAVIVTLLAIVAASYYQTVHGYPSGGGAYIVAHENLGVWPGLVAGGALLIDYVLTVAVSITAGVTAITSAFPEVLPLRTVLCLLAIALVAWGNLRGVRESGSIFAIPTYAFVGIMLALIGIGIVRVATGNLVAPPLHTLELPAATQAITLFLVLRAFSSGCAALTGVEAISNGIPAFEKPESDNAGKTLIAMAVLLGTMFIGITVLARYLHITPVGHESVISQIGRLVFGQGPLYLVLQGATALILVLAANTSFADFPRLSAILARDRYMPRQFMNRGDRLVFANGIIFLALIASLLVIIFQGDTHRLIPLYAVGVFLSFTLSQSGMVRHWKKVRGDNWRLKAAVNTLGACATGVVLVVLVASKFAAGAWIVTLLIPVVVFSFHAVKQHYTSLAQQLSLRGQTPEPWTNVATHKRHKVVVPIAGVHRGTLPALHFARTMSADVTAVLVDVDPRDTELVRERWKEWGHEVPLVVLESPYRSTINPLLKYLDEVDARDPERGAAVVVLPEFVPARWWQHLLHNQTAVLLKTLLHYRTGEAHRDRVIIDVPYHLSR
ncbi:MAG: APC family permease [Anaerolineae bacterium]